MDDKILLPRKLNEFEEKIIFSVLPESKKGYRKYREKIKDYYVIGFNNPEHDSNLILGPKDLIPEFPLFVSPVFASGAILYKDLEVYITVHEEIENTIEVDFPGALKKDYNDELKRWSYSDWLPGDKSPFDDSYVREIELLPGKIIVAIAPLHKRIWVYEQSSGINHFIPVTNFYNEIMRIKSVKEPSIVLNSNLIFEDLNTYTDSEIGKAFLNYNKQWKKVGIDYSAFTTNKKEEPKGLFKRIFKWS